MSLVMAIRCGDSAVVMADSQETYDGFKTTVDKIVPMGSSEFDVGFTAAANCVGLIDAFADELARRLGRSTASNEAAIRAELSEALISFHQSAEFLAYPADTSADKLIVGIVCVRLKTTREVLLYRFQATALAAIATYHITGFEHQVYSQIAHRLFETRLTTLQGVIVCLYVFSLAKHTSSVIGPPIRCLVASPSEISIEDQGRIDELEKLVDQTSMAVDALLLAAPDSTNPTVNFRMQLNKLHASLFKMRTESLRLATHRAFRASMASPDVAARRVGQLLPRGAPLNFTIGLGARPGELGGAPFGTAGTEVIHLPDLYRCLSHDRYLAAMLLQDFVNALLISRETSVGWHLATMDGTLQLMRTCYSIEIAAQKMTDEYEAAGSGSEAVHELIKECHRGMQAGQTVIRKIAAGISPLNHPALTEMVKYVESVFTDSIPDGFADRLLRIPTKWK